MDCKRPIKARKVIIWIIGLSGSGKTTIGHELWKQMREDGQPTIFMDGDEIRAIFSLDKTPSDYSIRSRRLNAERIFELCSWLDRNDANVVCCVLSIFPDLQERARVEFSKYIEVFVDVPIEILIQRNNKGVYTNLSSIDAPNIVGVDIPFPRPVKSHVRIDNSTFSTAPDLIAQDVMEYLHRGSSADEEYR